MNKGVNKQIYIDKYESYKDSDVTPASRAEPMFIFPIFLDCKVGVVITCLDGS